MTKQTITSPRSPVKDPVAGTLLRISPDLSGGREPPMIECVADGFRNAYSFDFNPDGEPFTYDSDNERCVGLPWYEPCRFYHVVPGGNYGWRSPQLGQFWRKPPYFIDCVPPVCYLGRGSPTGVACYRHTHFPEKYRGGFFLADWTFGRIHFVPLKPKHSTYEGTPEVFAEAKGTSGFAPTSLAVHPKTGELLVSIGGRGTRGGVYRIAHEKNAPGAPIAMAKRSLEWTPADGKRWREDCSSDSPLARRKALELLLRWREKVFSDPFLKDAVKPNLSHGDPLVRIAAARTVPAIPVLVGNDGDTQAKLALALVADGIFPTDALATALDILRNKDAPDQLKLQAIRVVQLVVGDLTDPKSVGTVFEGYTFRKPVPKATAARILAALPQPRQVFGLSAEERRRPLTDLDRETVRIIAALRGGDQMPQLVSHWVGDFLDRAYQANNLRDEIHFLACLGRFDAQANIDTDGAIAQSLVTMEERRLKRNLPADTFWPLRIDELAAALIPGHHFLSGRLVNNPGFGRPEHASLVKHLDKEWRERAVPKFLQAAEKSQEWTPGVVALLGGLPEKERSPRLRNLWEKPDLRDAIVRVLPPEKGEEAKFVVGLGSFDPEVVRISAAALEKLAPPGAAELAAAVKSLRRLAPDDKKTRAAVVALLQKWTGQTFDADAKAWAEWVAKNHAEAAKLLTANDGFDAAAWKKREAGIAWDNGDATRGRAAFVKASCAACHDGGRSLGPSLLGVAKRFGRDDLLTAILQPGKDVSARYRPTRVATTDEKVHVGILIYEAQDGVILQTAADSAVRIAGADIASKRPVDASFMPAGLLDKLTDAEIQDLFAYLRSLEEPK